MPGERLQRLVALVAEAPLPVVHQTAQWLTARLGHESVSVKLKTLNAIAALAQLAGPAALSAMQRGTALQVTLLTNFQGPPRESASPPLRRRATIIAMMIDNDWSAILLTHLALVQWR